MNRPAGWLLLLWSLARFTTWHGPAAEPQDAVAAAPTPTQTTDSIVRLLVEKENLQLKGHNALLRKENQQLRRLLSERPGPSTNLPAPTIAAVATNESSSSAAPVLTHWLTAGGKRHSPDCRYFKKADGRACGPHEGTACKICGG